MQIKAFRSQVANLDERRYLQKKFHILAVCVLREKNVKQGKVYLNTQTQICKQDQLMFAQELPSVQKSRNGWKFNQKLGLFQKISFLALTPNFKFKQLTTLNKNKRLHLIHGQLVYNNGTTVVISISHQNLFDRTLNKYFQEGTHKMVYSIESRESLIYSGKVVGLPDQMCELWVKECEKEVLARKRTIIHLLAVIGFQIDNQNQLMKKIIYQKNWLKQQLDLLISKSNKQKIENIYKQFMINENEENNVVIFGPEEEDVDIQIDQSKITPQDKQGKKVEGGYFSIQNQQYLINNKKTQYKEKTILCRKTLRSKKKAQEHARQMSKKKMKKQIEIVQSIKNTKYLIKYYCKRDLDHLQEILMEKYDYSLQQYINYFADSLEVQHKILISKQIIQAVMILHSHGVVHRDIKPSNFLISDNMNNPGCYQIKIIDFAQSFSENISLYEGDYACSHPYSPLQCSEMKLNNNQRSQLGIINKEIDYWSVGMIIYEIFFRKLPVSFSRVFHLDIASSWKSELLLTVNQRQKYGLAVVEDIITLLCIKMLKIEQQKRMKLETAMGIMKLVEEYVSNILKIVEEIQ